MMRVGWSAFLVAACVLPCGLAAETPLLHAPFDGSDQAVLTTGTAEEVTPYTSMGGPFVPGVKGQARVLGGQNRCSFFVNDGFFPARGTLSMWVRPEDWTPASRHFVFFARLSLTEVQREYVRVILYKYWNTNELALLAENTVGEKRHSLIRTPIDSWQQGQWHHLAVTWDEKHYRLYVDGERKGEAAAVELPSQGRWEIAVGTPYPSWAYIGKERSAIDEVAVWPKAMSTDEIKAAHETGAKALSMRGPEEGPR
ncbi:MAG: LamG domain-containing protein, partial [Planctomycetota bacterium]